MVLGPSFYHIVYWRARATNIFMDQCFSLEIDGELIVSLVIFLQYKDEIDTDSSHSSLHLECDKLQSSYFDIFDRSRLVDRDKRR